MIHSFSIGTYNIQKPDDGDWITRRPLINKAIKDADLDVVCLQEFSEKKDDKKFFLGEFKRHGYELCTHTEKRARTSVGVIWKKARFELSKRFTKSYEVMDEGTLRKRCFSAVDLKDKTTNKIVRIASVHLFTESMEAGKPYLGVGQLESFKKQLEDEPGNISRIIVAGDFNADFGRRRGDEVLDLIAKPQKNSNYIYRTLSRDNANKKISTKGRNKIDWIFAGIKKDTTKVPDSPKMAYHPVVNIPAASDHALHAVDISYQDKPEVKKEVIPLAPLKRKKLDTVKKGFNSTVPKITIKTSQQNVESPKNIQKRSCFAAFLKMISDFFAALLSRIRC